MSGLRKKKFCGPARYHLGIHALYDCFFSVVLLDVVSVLFYFCLQLVFELILFFFFFRLHATKLPKSISKLKSYSKNFRFLVQITVINCEKFTGDSPGFQMLTVV